MNPATQKEIKMAYTVMGRTQVIFGGASTAGITSIKFGGGSSISSRYGLDLAMQVDDYRDDDYHYTASHLYGGIFLALLF